MSIPNYQLCRQFTQKKYIVLKSLLNIVYYTLTMKMTCLIILLCLNTKSTLIVVLVLDALKGPPNRGLPSSTTPIFAHHKQHSSIKDKTVIYSLLADFSCGSYLFNVTFWSIHKTLSSLSSSCFFSFFFFLFWKVIYLNSVSIFGKDTTSLKWKCTRQSKLPKLLQIPLNFHKQSTPFFF